MPLISHVTCHAMPIAKPRLRACLGKMHSRGIHEFTICRDFNVGRAILPADTLSSVSKLAEKPACSQNWLPHKIELIVKAGRPS
jgi:hypothetical protein